MHKGMMHCIDANGVCYVDEICLCFHAGGREARGA